MHLTYNSETNIAKRNHTQKSVQHLLTDVKHDRQIDRQAGKQAKKLARFNFARNPIYSAWFIAFNKTEERDNNFSAHCSSSSLLKTMSSFIIEYWQRERHSLALRGLDGSIVATAQHNDVWLHTSMERSVLCVCLLFSTDRSWAFKGLTVEIEMNDGDWRGRFLPERGYSYCEWWLGKDQWGILNVPMILWCSDVFLRNQLWMNIDSVNCRLNMARVQ